jgi:hypothetical protein
VSFWATKPRSRGVLDSDVDELAPVQLADVVEVEDELVDADGLCALLEDCEVVPEVAEAP